MIHRYLLAAGAMLMTCSFSAKADFAYGADPSWMTTQEDRGIKFYQADEATETTVEDLLADYGFNAARLRVWVNPENFQTETAGYCNMTDVLAKARRLHAKGLDIMLCVHFSDCWADPAQQRIPQAWVDAVGDLNKLTGYAVEHVQEICNALKEENIPVKWIQIGNEDGTGFMLHYADGSSIPNCLTGVSSAGAAGYIHVFNACARKAREIYPDILTVHHLANGDNWGKITWNLSKTCPVGGSVEDDTRLDADYVGLSMYPLMSANDNTAAWKSAANNSLQVIRNINSTYGMRSLVVEVGMNNDYSTATPGGTSQLAHSTQCSKDASEFAEYFVYEAQRTGVCDGVFYWEPQSSYMDVTSPTGTSGSGYKMGAMLDVDRKKYSWGSRVKLAPNGYWDMIKLLANGYEPEPEPEPELGDWNLKYSLDDKVSWQTVPFTLDANTGLYVLPGFSDDSATWCMNYFIVNKDESESYIASEGVKLNQEYPLYSTLSGTYKGWSGWLQDKWLSPSHTILFDKEKMTLKITDDYSGVQNVDLDFDADRAPLYYNLQGLRITNPQPGHLYIVRRPHTTTRELYRR